MDQVFEYDCREAAADSLGRLADLVNIGVWTLESAQFESCVDRVGKELTTLKVILDTWKRLEAERKAAKQTISEEVKAEHPIAFLASVQQTATFPIMEETTTDQKGDNHDA